MLQLLRPLPSHEGPVVLPKWPWASTRLCGGGRRSARVLGAWAHLSGSRKVPACLLLFLSVLAGQRTWGDSRWQIRQRGDSLWIGEDVFCYLLAGVLFFFNTLLGLYLQTTSSWDCSSR